jgi:hypothetical protein
VGGFAEIHRRSLDEPEAFCTEAASQIDWSPAQGRPRSTIR